MSRGSQDKRFLCTDGRLTWPSALRYATGMNTPSWTTEAIRTYYEQNTQLFLSFVGVSPTYTIHRSLWPDGVAGLDEALQTSNRLIQAEIEQMAADQALSQLAILDLGCGVGGTLFYLAAAARRSRRKRWASRSARCKPGSRAPRGQEHRWTLTQPCLFAEADFLAVPVEPATWRRRSRSRRTSTRLTPSTILAEAARILRPGGRLILCDDFLSAKAMSPFLSGTPNAAGC